MAGNILFFDTEVDAATGRVGDYGAVKDSGEQLHTSSPAAFSEFARGSRFVCGHNILSHDLKYTGDLLQRVCPGFIAIDTLCLSPLLFPAKPYHRLLKDDKLFTDQLNNPLNDALKARDLFYDEVSAFRALPQELQALYRGLLGRTPQFSGFFAYVGTQLPADPENLIRQLFSEQICSQADLGLLIRKSPVELAYTLALIRTEDKYSITPPWVMRSFPRMDNVMKLLRGTPCAGPCPFCGKKLDVRRRLRDIFGFDSFRTYDGEPLQEQAAAAAVAGKSLLAVFPTGGGKSVTFQLPALIAGETSRGLTVVISPLQSLMKDQVDNLESRGIVDAVTINGLLNPIERKDAIDRVANGLASILYISPEALRSRTIESLLRSRNVVRFVIDEAHCFSAWGQDFRVDYLYIGTFIRKLKEAKNLNHDIPVSCFTATAKQKVISDIRDYFRKTLGLEMELFTTGAARKNLHYAVLYREDDEEKYRELRSLIQAKNCPTIVYVSRVRRTEKLAARLQADGYSAQPYNGQMDSTEKIRIQNAFIQGETQIIVATSAFGMGVDKKDVRLVVHYDISDSLENYIQEAGRAGRDEDIQADCYVLFNDEDLDKHFILLNQTRLSISEIQQVWRAVKDLTKNRVFFSCSALEIARQAGWDDTVYGMETRVTTAIAALEEAGYVERGNNAPHIYADSILVSNMMEASARLDSSRHFTDGQRETAKRVIRFLISRRSTSAGGEEDAESRVDYLADRLGLPKEEVIDAVLLMREEGLLADHMDLIAHIRRTDTRNRSSLTLRRFLRLEEFLLEHFPEGESVNYKELNDLAMRSGVRKSTVKDIRTILFYWTLRGYLKKRLHAQEDRFFLERGCEIETQRREFQRRAALSSFIIEKLFAKCPDETAQGQEEHRVPFSVTELQTAFNAESALRLDSFEAEAEDVKAALLYLSKIQALTLDGGFLVSYNAMQLKRLRRDSHIQYKREDYRQLDEFYRQRIQQIHIVGEYAHLMVRDYGEALQFVSDYFQMDYKGFLSKYFKGNRLGEINRNITPEKYEKLFGVLSPAQRRIIEDEKSRYIVVAAGPGSGKTRILVHKLASLLMLEDVKHEQLLMLTFSRAAATEFKRRLLDLIGNAAHFVEIKTFHSYCFDLLGKVGTLEDAENVVAAATEKIRQGEVEQGRITKTVLVIDEAQDMDAREFSLVQALMEQNEGMRVIAVGDDDQNIYAFRGSDSAHMKALLTEYHAAEYELPENYRSRKNIVALSNAFAATMAARMKTEPIRAVQEEPGRVTLTLCRSRNLELPLADRLAAEAEEGTCCVLTAANEDALRMTGLLKRRGIPARLLQTNEGFDLCNLLELRRFLEELGEGDCSCVLDEKHWNKALERMEAAFPESACLPLCREILETFRCVNRTAFHSDLLEYLHESRLEDFEAASRETVLLSTLHKAKGREFDRVYLLLRGCDWASEDWKRAVYVGMTRARAFLHIFTDSPLFDRLDLPFAERFTDNTAYPEPEELLLQLTHRDVFLGYFKSRPRLVRALHSGSPLIPEDTGLRNPDGRSVARYSQAFQKRLSGLREKGYTPYRAAVRFLVAWKGEGDREETPIVLPDLVLKKDTETSDRIGDLRL